MKGFSWRQGQLHCENVPLEAIAEAAGTPTYIYSAPAIRAAYQRLAAAFAPLSPEIHYAAKANSNLHLLRLLRGLGAGMDVVSGGELEKAWLAGTPMSEIVFAGVGKTEAEVHAALDGGASPLRAAADSLGAPDPSDRGPVGLFNVESPSELRRIASRSKSLGMRARFCLRVNPNVDPHTHEYTTTGKQENKFGIDVEQISPLVEWAATQHGLEFRGLHVHIGSPVPMVEPYLEAIEVVLRLADDLDRSGHPIHVLNLGGGWPVEYTEGSVPPIEDYAEGIVPLLAARVRNGLQVLLEPGRSLVANAAVLLTRVQHVKRGRAKTFVICDAGMHTLIRPALYRAFHFAWPVAWNGPPPRIGEDDADFPDLELCDIVGPICETGDFLARDRRLPRLEQNELLAIYSAGAYGMAMASNYNDHGRPAEVLVDTDRVEVINERQTLASLLATERAARPLRLPAAAVSVPAPR